MKFIIINDEGERLNVDQIASWKREIRMVPNEREEVVSRDVSKIIHLPPTEETVLKIVEKNGTHHTLLGALAVDAIAILEAI